MIMGLFPRALAVAAARGCHLQAILVERRPCINAISTLADMLN
jgi:hypothetical protein